MIIPIRYVENSLKNWEIYDIKNQKKKKIINRAFKRKTCSKFSKVYYLQNYIRYYTFCYYHY